MKELRDLTFRDMTRLDDSTVEKVQGNLLILSFLLQYFNSIIYLKNDDQPLESNLIDSKITSLQRLHRDAENVKLMARNNTAIVLSGQQLSVTSQYLLQLEVELGCISSNLSKVWSSFCCYELIGDRQRCRNQDC